MTEGLVKIIIKKDTGEIANTFHLKKGSFFGEVALLTQSVRSSDVVAIDFCICESFSRDHF